MCMASFLGPGIPVDVDGLLNGGLCNSDGSGWAIADNGLMIMGRSLKVEEALDKFCDARARHPGGVALFHSRFATHGSTRLDNIHPFFVGGNHRTLVAHNGILPSEAHPAKGDDRSDTRVFADEILPTRFRHLDSAKTQKKLAKWCGTFNKLVILTVDPRYQASAYIVNQAHGEWDDATGIWHSNRDFREPFGRWVTATKSAPENAWDGTSALDWACQFCGIGIMRYGYCDKCDTCRDCYEVFDDCKCYERYTSTAKSAEESAKVFSDKL